SVRGSFAGLPSPALPLGSDLLLPALPSLSLPSPFFPSLDCPPLSSAGFDSLGLSFFGSWPGLAPSAGRPSVSAFLALPSRTASPGLGSVSGLRSPFSLPSDGPLPASFDSPGLPSFFGGGLALLGLPPPLSSSLPSLPSPSLPSLALPSSF